MDQIPTRHFYPASTTDWTNPTLDFPYQVIHSALGGFSPAGLITRSDCWPNPGPRHLSLAV